MPQPIPDIPVLEGATVRVRPWTHHDVGAVVAAGHDPFITSITTVPADATEDEARAFVDRQTDRPRTDSGHARAIASLDDDKAIGHLFTSLTFLGVGRAEMGYWTIAERRRSGAASEALDLTAAWVLENLPINRITLFIEPWNEASIRTAQRAGFTCDGLLRAWNTYDDGAARDMLAFGRIKEQPR